MYEATGSRVHARVLGVLGDSHQAQEVTQEVFLVVWQTAGRFDPLRGSGLSWLLTIAHRKAVDRVRHSESWRRRDTTAAQLGRRAPYDQTIESAIASLDAQTVRTALGTLTPRQRQAIELAYFGGYTHTEVSSLLQVPLGTAKGRIRDGLLRLRDLMSPVVTEPA
ncbi:sigma-70 family RNA polymerase sigma factor [Nocardioides panacis]|jgi:RNA polymerase sigma-70 factor (ECF subfamily)|uniref:RNA polymerase sigma factor n=2 Tax=Nocardioides panacis TaxID=2849501 RepID=A0A975Y2F3_9ACTN|nr:sigma-70 family RNA polymerase sigma factor [Nocardioides panacis]